MPALDMAIRFRGARMLIFRHGMTVVITTGVARNE
jgi:hypothetical protein